MSTNISIHIAAGTLADPASPLNAYASNCRHNANRLANLALSRQFTPITFFDAEATRSNLLTELDKLHSTMSRGDSLILTFSGHGERVVDTDQDECDPYDEAWVMYDAYLLDDELWQQLALFEAGVQIVVLADCCYADEPASNDCDEPPSELANPAITDPDVLFTDATVRFISGCREDQLAYFEGTGSRFVNALLTVWDEGNFAGTYQHLMDEIFVNMSYQQLPAHALVGPVSDLTHSVQAFSAFPDVTPFPIFSDPIISTPPPMFPFDQPILRLRRQEMPTGRPKYFLHAVSFLQDTDYRATNHELNPTPAAQRYTLKLFVKKRNRFGLQYATPVVHTINLGRLNLSFAFPLVEVEVVDEDTNIPMFSKKVLIHRDDADIEPMGMT